MEEGHAIVDSYKDYDAKGEEGGDEREVGEEDGQDGVAEEDGTAEDGAAYDEDDVVEYGDAQGGGNDDGTMTIIDRKRET